MTRVRYAAAVTAFAVFTGAGAAHDRAAGLPGGLKDHPHRITEDSPGWDCHTMGNHVCGPAAYPAWERP